MENLGLWIYLGSLANGVLLVSLIGVAVGLCGLLIGFVASEDTWSIDEKEAALMLAKKGFIILIVSVIVAIFTPSKETCYQILGVNAAVELYQNSDALQQLPEKSVKALNRLLDSIAVEDGEE